MENSFDSFQPAHLNQLWFDSVLNVMYKEVRKTKQLYIFLPFSEPNHRPSVLWCCWLGHVTRKIVSEMTYYIVSSGTLNSTIPYHCRQLLHCCSFPTPAFLARVFIPRDIGLIMILITCLCSESAFPLTCTWLHLRCDVMLVSRKGNINRTVSVLQYCALL